MALDLLQVILVWHVLDADISAIIVAREDVLRTEWFIHISGVSHRRDIAVAALCPPICCQIIKLILIRATVLASLRLESKPILVGEDQLSSRQVILTAIDRQVVGRQVLLRFHFIV